MMADIADRANDRMQADLDRAIKAARGVSPAKVESADDCQECGECIPSARQIAIPGVQNCVDCQELVEARL